MASKSLRLAVPVVAALAIAGLSGGAWYLLSGNFGGGAGLGIGGPFALTDGDGHTVTDRDLRGRYVLVYFGYTFCPDVCPTTLNAVAAALDQLGPRADKLQALFITVDPARDTPQVVKDYAAAFSPRIIGLSGTVAQIAEVARAYRVYFAVKQPDAPGAAYTVDHSSLLYLLGPDGRFLVPIRADLPPDQMAAEIARHLS